MLVKVIILVGIIQGSLLHNSFPPSKKRNVLISLINIFFNIFVNFSFQISFEKKGFAREYFQVFVNG
jgi:hypothetical protein